MNSRPSTSQNNGLRPSRPLIRGSVSIEGLIVIPVFLMAALLILYGILAQIQFDTFEEDLTRALLDSTTNSVGPWEMEALARSHEGLEMESFELSRNTMTVSISFENLFRRRWVVVYDVRLPAFESLLYVTDTGKKYHHFGCRHLSQSMVPLVASEALLNFDPCGVCSLN